VRLSAGGRPTKVSFKMPQNIGTWRIAAVAVARKSKKSQESGSISSDSGKTTRIFAVDPVRNPSVVHP